MASFRVGFDSLNSTSALWIHGWKRRQACSCKSHKFRPIDDFYKKLTRCDLARTSCVPFNTTHLYEMLVG